MSVVEEIQSQQLAGPNTRSFDPKVWLNRGLDASCSHEDLLLIATGIQFYAGLDELRGRLSFIERKEIPSGQKQLSFISLCNRECLLAEVIASEGIAQIPPGEVVSIDKLATQKIEISGGGFSASEVCETAVDVSAALLRMCPAVVAQPLDSLTDQPWDEIVHDFKIANAYVCIEDLWMGVVWNGLRMLQPSPVIYGNRDKNAEKFRVVSEHRYQMTSAQNFSIRFLNIKSAIDEKVLTPAPMNRLTAKFQHDGDSGIFISSADKEHSAYAAAVKSLIPSYYRKMAEESAPEDCDLSLLLVIEGHLLLMGLARSIADPAMQDLSRERNEDQYQASWTRLAPLFSVTSLIDSIESGLNIERLPAEKLVNFLTFRGTKKKAPGAPPDELWSSPLVRAAPDTCTLCIHPLIHPNFHWLIDVWLKRLGFPLDFRGSEFEVFARNSIESRIRNSSLAEISQICKSSFKFTPRDGREEEIDLLIVLGNKVIVGEIKCFLQPVSPVDRKNHRAKLFDAARQVERKAEAVRSAAADFRARASEYSISIPQEIDVLSVVILNHAFGAGEVIENVPIVDLRIIEMFFEGSMDWMVQVTSDGDVTAGKREFFYKSTMDAMQGIGSYLREPPQIRHLKDAIRPRVTSLFFPGVEGNQVHKLQLEIDADSLLPI